MITRVSEPTPWCAAMVVVPKSSGTVRICVDMKPLNENALREVHPMPKVDTTLAQFTGATMFSKPDANSGLWQIPLAKESRLLTTFITPYGHSASTNYLSELQVHQKFSSVTQMTSCLASLAYYAT